MKAIYRSKLLWVVLVLVLVVLIVRAMLPFWVRDYVNRKLSELEDYRGHVADVDIHLWRGAYSIHAVEIKKVTGNVPVPFFSAPAVDLSVEWKALFEGALVGEIHFEQPKINFVNGRSKATTQVGVDQPWTDKIRELFPLKINRFTVRDGELHYRDFSRTPQVDVEVDQIRMVATNLTNSRKLSETLKAEIEIAGRPLRSGQMRANIDMDPYAAKPTFALELEADAIPLVKLNDFAKAYAGITFEEGMLRVATAMDSKQGQFTGYFEPVFDKMVIFDPSEDNENPIDFIWQGIVGGLTRIIRNHPKDRFGTKVPLSGSFDDPAPAVLDTVFNVFKNAFIKAFEGKLSNEDIDLKEVQESPETKKEGDE
ncbi:MAG: DUF748 domain-containing protein [Chthoniobacterales bacterium]